MKTLHKTQILSVVGGTKDECAEEIKKDAHHVKSDLKEFMDDTLKTIGHGSQKAADKINETVDKNTK